MEIASQILQLSRLSFPAGTQESILQKYNGYFMKILNSRMGGEQMDDHKI